MFSLKRLQGRGYVIIGNSGNRSLVQLRQGNFQNEAPRENYSTLDHVLQLTHVARPGPVDQFLHRRRRNRFSSLPHTTGVFLHEVMRQQWNVLTTLTYRRNPNRKDV